MNMKTTKTKGFSRKPKQTITKIGLISTQKKKKSKQGHEICKTYLYYAKV
jgi:hypothetical protein